MSVANRKHKGDRVKGLDDEAENEDGIEMAKVNEQSEINAVEKEGSGADSGTDPEKKKKKKVVKRNRAKDAAKGIAGLVPLLIIVYAVFVGRNFYNILYPQFPTEDSRGNQLNKKFLKKIFGLLARFEFWLKSCWKFLIL